MVEITCDLNTKLLNISVSGDMFADTIETLKLKRCRWNNSIKAWTASISDYDSIVKELTYDGETLEISELTKRQIAQYKQSLCELEVSTQRRKIRLELMNYKPLQGKHPYEDFQLQDISRALNQNRFLFNWEMGLGKSYALAALLVSLRYYDLIDKSIILSTGVGVFNLKDELLKFGKDLRSDEIYSVSSVSELEDRDIFNTSKYPYKIIIMTYDTFKEIKNYYDDGNTVKKSAVKKVSELESKIDELTKSIKDEYRYNCKKVSDAANDPRLKKLRNDLSKAKDKLHPSRTVDFRNSYMPIDKWLGGKDGVIFLDECHSVNNPKSRRSETLNMNLSIFKYRYEFTGTLADKYEKLYEPLFILDKNLTLGKQYNEWLYEYNDVGTKWSKYAINPNGWHTDKISELNKVLLDTYASKRKMLDCLDLPLNYQVPTILLDMTTEQREIYESFIKEEIRLSKERKLSGEATQKNNMLNMFQIFSMACDNIECIKNSPTFQKFSPELQQKINSYKYLEHNKKLNALSSILEDRVDEEDERGIVWYQHPLTKDSLKVYLKKYNPVIIDAGLTNEELNKRIKEFKSNANHKIIIASINILNTSITLTECKFSVYLERTYSYQIWSQSKGRIWRPSQTSVTRVYTMSYKDSIDNLQLENLIHKGEIVNSLLNRDYIDQSIWKKIFNFNLGDDIC